MSDYDFAGKAREEFENVRRNNKRPNILVCGGTGAGKSTLINQTLSDKGVCAHVGAGRPVTQEISKYQGEQVTVYDSPGYESGEENQQKYKDTVLKLISNNMGSVEDRIHIVWYCISQGNHRVFEIDVKTINDIKKLRIPIAVVLTQTDKATEDESNQMTVALKQECPGITVFQTSTDESLGLSPQPLLEWAIDSVDEALREAFISASKISTERKLAAGRDVVHLHIGIAVVIAATPIPLSDGPLLLANQATLIARLASLWDCPSVLPLVAGALPGQVLSTVGRTVAGSLLKLIPGPVSAVGSLINAGIASALTAGIGYSFNEVFGKMAKDELEGRKSELSSYLKLVPGLFEQYENKYKKENKS